ncbi:hypothetical protein GCM10009605_21880 [Nocardiopsis composta]
MGFHPTGPAAEPRPPGVQRRLNVAVTAAGRHPGERPGLRGGWKTHIKDLGGPRFAVPVPAAPPRGAAARRE